MAWCRGSVGAVLAGWLGAELLVGWVLCSGARWLGGSVARCRGRCGWYVVLQSKAFSYGFAHGLMASLVAQFGCAPQVALAAGGWCGHDRASVRVTAHALKLAAVCRV